VTESTIRPLSLGDDAAMDGKVRPLTGPIDLSQIDLNESEGRQEVRAGLTRFLMPYKFAIDEVMTKLRILQEEFTQTGEYNPIEHISGRLKDPDNIIEKMERRGAPLKTDLVRETITDIAGVRVVCSFVSDVYRVFELLTAHSDITVYQVKDYIAKPKENGYRSLHLLLEVPVYLSSGPVQTIVEVQLRTIAMDFWASLEHKIYYKYDREVPEQLLDGLRDAAEQASQLDSTMEWLHITIRGGERDTLVRRGSDTLHAQSSGTPRDPLSEVR
jgi:putative GTP pyrophosphokinase